MDHLEQFFADKARAVMHRFSFTSFKKYHKTLLSAIISFGKETSSEIIWRQEDENNYTSIISDYKLVVSKSNETEWAWLVTKNKLIQEMWSEKSDSLSQALGDCAKAYYEHRSKNINYEKHLIIR